MSPQKKYMSATNSKNNVKKKIKVINNRIFYGPSLKACISTSSQRKHICKKYITNFHIILALKVYEILQRILDSCSQGINWALISLISIIAIINKCMKSEFFDKLFLSKNMKSMKNDSFNDFFFLFIVFIISIFRSMNHFFTDNFIEFKFVE